MTERNQHVRDRAAGATSATLQYLHPLFKAVGITAVIFFAGLAVLALALIIFGS